MTAKQFFNHNFFEGNNNRKRVVVLGITDASHCNFFFPKLELLPATPLGVDHFPLAEGPLVFRIEVENGDSYTSPAITLDNLQAVTIERICRAASAVESATPSPAPETVDDAAEQATTIAEDGKPSLDFTDFDRIEYRYNKKTTKFYLLEKLKPEAAAELGQEYRVYEDKEGDRKYMSAKSPVYRTVVKEYEVKNGLRD